MSKLKISARTLEEAVTEATIKLGITSDMLDYEILEKGSSGFLGIGKKNIVILAFKKEDRKESKNKTEYGDREDKKIKERNFTPATEETRKTCETFVEGLLERMKVEGKVNATIGEDGILYINVEGDNMGILIGKRGQNLEAMQSLVSRVANKKQEGYIRVQLDTENYRKRRKETLENLARNIACKVKRTKKKVELEPMSSYERRIIHYALQDEKEIVTKSEGEEPFRYVVIQYR